MSAWKVIFAVLLIFIAGAITGSIAAKNKLPESRPPGGMIGGNDRRLEYLRRMKEKLDLTSVQHERVETLLKESQERLNKIWEPVSPQIKNEFEAVRKAMLAELSAEQQAKFQKMAEMGRSRQRPDQRQDKPRTPHDHGTNPPPHSRKPLPPQ